MDVLAWLSDLPVGLMYAGFLTFAFVRGWAYYATGFLAGSRATGERWDRARDRVAAQGPRAVIATWPVYGLAAATQVVCGAARVAPLGFGAALLLMSVIWAGLQTALGVAVLQALASKAAPVIVVVLVAIVGGVLLRAALSRCRAPREA